MLHSQLLTLIFKNDLGTALNNASFYRKHSLEAGVDEEVGINTLEREGEVAGLGCCPRLDYVHTGLVARRESGANPELDTCCLSEERPLSSLPAWTGWGK